MTGRHFPQKSAQRTDGWCESDGVKKAKSFRSGRGERGFSLAVNVCPRYGSYEDVRVLMAECTPYGVKSGGTTHPRPDTGRRVFFILFSL